MIDRRTVVTAAHCVASGETNIIDVDPGAVSFNPDGVTNPIAVSSAIAHPSYSDSANFADIAVIALGTSAANIAIVPLAVNDPAVGTVVTIVGHGRFGTGDLPDAPSDNQRRFATNVVASLSGGRIFYDFDDPSLADPTLTAFEGASGPGDSGGPMLVPGGVGGWTLVGVTRGGPTANYGVTKDYTSVATYRDFLNNNRSLIAATAQASDGLWTDPTHWTTVTSSGGVVINGLTPTNRDQAAAFLQGTAARYYDVILDADAVTTIQNGDDIEVDTLRINDADAELVIEAGGRLEAVLAEAPTNTVGVEYAGVRIDDGSMGVSGTVITPVNQQNGGTVTINSGGMLITTGAYDLNGGFTDVLAGGEIEAAGYDQSGGVTSIFGTLDTDDIDVSGGVFSVIGAGVLNNTAEVDVTGGTFGFNAQTINTLLVGGGQVNLNNNTVNVLSSVALTGGLLANGTAGNSGTGQLLTGTFQQTGGLLNAGPEIQLDPLTGALLPGQDIDSFISATFSASAVGGTIFTLGTGSINVSGGGAAHDVIIKTSSTDGLLPSSEISALGPGIYVFNDFAGGSGNTIIEIDGNVTSISSDAILVAAAASTGNVVITGAGDVTGGPDPGNDGIDVRSGGTVFVDVDGAISGDPGINILSLGGNITVMGTGDVTGTNEGILANTFPGNGDIVIARDGNVTGTVGISASTDNGGLGTGDIHITAVAARTVQGISGEGISANADLGTITIDGAGAVIGTDYGILAQSERGSITITGTGPSTGGAAGTGIGAGISNPAATGNILINRGGTITGFGGVTTLHAGSGRTDIDIVSATSVVNATTTAIVALNAGSGVVDIVIGADATINPTADHVIFAATNTGALHVTADSALTSNGGNGILAGSTSGAVTVQGAGAVTGAIEGIVANTVTGGITITGTGATTGGAASAAIRASINDGAATEDILINRGGAITGGFGVVTTNAGSGRTDIDIVAATSVLNATITAINATATGAGLIDIMIGADATIGATAGDVIVASTNTGALQVTADSALTSNGDNGINAASTSGTITVDGAAAVTGATNGILAANGTGGITITGTGATTGGAANSAIRAWMINPAATGNILINRGGAITGGFGVVTTNAGSGRTDIDIIAATSVVTATTNAINAATTGSGLIDIEIGADATINPTNGDVVGASSTSGSVRVVADTGLFSNAGNGIVVVSTTGDVEVKGIGTITTPFGKGIDIDSAGGNVTIAQDAVIAAGSNGIEATTSGTGTIDITVTQHLTGGFDVDATPANGLGSYAISATAENAGAGNTIDVTIETGVIVSSLSQDAVLLNGALGSANRLTNRGIILGTVTGDGDETFDNVAGALWAPADLDGGASLNAFGPGTDTINNGGTLQAFDSASPNLNAANITITGLETFNNSGLINMQNGQGTASLTTDSIAISSETATSYVGDRGILAVDSFLGAHASPGDLLTIGEAAGTAGSTSGTTSIAVNDTNAGGPGVFNPIGIEVVRVESAAGGNTARDHFDLMGGPIQKDLWIWDLGLDDTRSNAGRATADVHVLFSRPTDIVQFSPYFATAALRVFEDSLNPWINRRQTLADELRRPALPAPVALAFQAPVALAKEPQFVPPIENAVNVWAAPYASGLHEENQSTLTFFNRSFTAVTDYTQRTYGVMAGIDFVNRIAQGNGIIAGVLGGYVSSSVTPKQIPVSGDIEGGSIGAYISAVFGSFSFDVVGKADFLGFDWHAPSLGVSASSDVTTYGGRVGAAYKIDFANLLPLGQSWVEPYANLTYAKSEWDQFAAFATTFDLNGNDSLMGRTGLRIGVDLAAIEFNHKHFLGVGVAHAFDSESTADILSGGAVLPLTHDYDATSLELQAGFKIDRGNLSLAATTTAQVSNDIVAYGAKGVLNYRFGLASPGFYETD